jgi:hypothetical protein
MKENTKDGIARICIFVGVVGLLWMGIGTLTGNIGRTPKAGEVWESSFEHSPWDKADTVTVLGVKKGWVLYDMPRLSITNSFPSCQASAFFTRNR